jgi:L,D-transpeptidase catalytic domain
VREPASAQSRYHAGAVGKYKHGSWQKDQLAESGDFPTFYPPVQLGRRWRANTRSITLTSEWTRCSLNWGLYQLSLKCGRSQVQVDFTKAVADERRDTPAAQPSMVNGHLLKKIGLVALALIVTGLGVWRFWPRPALPQNSRADLVVVHKSARRLELYRNGVLLKSYTVSLGRHPNGPKQQQGDGKTPEGEYRLDYRKADSSFHRALHISYPGPGDIVFARTRGIDPGGSVMIHGMKNGLGWLGRLHVTVDWTDGCVAVTDEEMDEIWRAVPDGTKILLKP